MKKRDLILAKQPHQNRQSSRRGVWSSGEPTLALVAVAKQISFPLSLAAQKTIRRTRTNDGVRLYSPIPRAFFQGIFDQTNLPVCDRRTRRNLMLAVRAGRA